jgi:hypothetical protein
MNHPLPGPERCPGGPEIATARNWAMRVEGLRDVKQPDRNGWSLCTALARVLSDEPTTFGGHSGRR